MTVVYYSSSERLCIINRNKCNSCVLAKHEVNVKNDVYLVVI